MREATYKDRPYTFTPDYDYDEPYAALWMWTEGNYGCDCNKSIVRWRVVR